MSDRALARDAGVSDTALRKRAKRHGWVKLIHCAPNIQPPPIPPEPVQPECKPERTQREPRIDIDAKPLASASIADLIVRGRSIILALMEELEFLNRHADELSELIEEHFSGERDDRVRFKLQRALDHETRTKSSAQLASALQKLQDAAPGKKEQAKADADTAGGKESGWGDDLESGAVGRPN